MGIHKTIVAAALLLATAACASGVTRDVNLDLSRPQLSSTGQKAGQVTVAMSPEVEQRLAGTIRFDRQRLQNTIQSALHTKGVLTPNDDPTLPTVEVNLTDVRVRSTANAVLFGIMAGDDRINGTVVVRSPDKAEMQKFNVTTSYGLGGFGGGQMEARMSWLYEEFAKQVANELTGSQPQSAAKQ
ncbi:MAG: DUF4410 domain-containing protein [Gemmatimonas sp.]